jgi:hypothetical protein
VKLALANFRRCVNIETYEVAGHWSRLPLGASLAFSEWRSCVSESLHPSAPHDLPGFITAPGDTDTLMVVVGVILIAAVLAVGNLYLRLHALPEQMAHKSQKLQFKIVAGGAGGVQPQNEKGVILQLHGVKVGVKLSASVGGVTITME